MIINVEAQKFWLRGLGLNDCKKCTVLVQCRTPSYVEEEGPAAPAADNQEVVAAGDTEGKVTRHLQLFTLLTSFRGVLKG